MFTRLSSPISKLRTTTTPTRLPLALALFSSTASSSSPSAAQLHRMSVKETVDSAILDNKVAVFSKSYCPYCKATKALFANEYPNVEVKILELDELAEGSEIQNYLYEKTGQRTVPNVFIGGKHIGGNDATQAAFKTGEITKLVAA